jgi:hypothetical protein
VTSLRELQNAFVDGVLHGSSQRACALIADRGLAPARRLAIYRNNASEGFLNTLAAGFPVVARLGGEDWFRQTGRAYMRAHPSRSGNLHHVGERFAAFLREQLEDTEFAYFAAVAELEWAYQGVLVAAEESALAIDALRSVAPEDYETLTFAVRSASRLVASAFPILAIWKANQLDREGAIRLDAGPSRVLVIRREDHVELRELGAAEFALLRAFAGGATFASAAESMLAEDGAADLGVVFARIVQLGVLAGTASTTESHLASGELLVGS